MSLGVVIKGPEGIVLSADSRVTLTAERRGEPPISINFDNATKLLSFAEPHNFVGVVTYGAAVIGLRTAHSFIPEFEVMLASREERLEISEYARLLADFYMRQWEEVMSEDYSGPPMMLIVGGYDPGAAYGRVFLINVPMNPTPIEQNPGDASFGMTWGGQLQMASRMIHGYDPMLPTIIQQELGLDDERTASLFKTLRQRLEFSIPYQVLPLQDCVDLAMLMVKTTMGAQDLAIAVRGVGGLIEVATITRTNGLRHIQKKSITIDTQED